MCLLNFLGGIWYLLIGSGGSGGYQGLLLLMVGQRGDRVSVAGGALRGITRRAGSSSVIPFTGMSTIIYHCHRPRIMVNG